MYGSYILMGIGFALFVLGLMDLAEKRESSLRDRLNATSTLEKMGKAKKEKSKFDPMAFLAKEIAQSGLEISLKELVNVSCLVSLLGFGLGWILTRKLAISLVFTVVGIFAPRFYIKSLREKRQAQISSQLEGVLQIMSASMKVNPSLLVALQNVAAEAPEPSRGEFVKVVQEISLGVRTEDALHHLRQRIASSDLDLALTAIFITLQQGGRLSEILDKIAHTIRERVKVQGELKSLTAQANLSGNLVAAVPGAMILIMNMVNPSYLSVFFNSASGQSALLLAMVLNVIGFFLCRKMSKVRGI